MSGNTDFLMLYQELGLSPDRCSLDEFKRAYRRRVSFLHPDRRPQGAADDDSPETMQRLTSLYGAAIAFERRFGRLPGAGPVSTRRHITIPTSGYSAANTGIGARREFPASPEPRSLRKRIVLALLILLALAWALWGVGTMTITQ